MKILITQLLFLSLFQHSYGQRDLPEQRNPPGKVSGKVSVLVSGQVSGKLTTAGGQPVPFANILLLKGGDSSLVKSALSDEKGVFVLENTLPGKYFLRYSSIGYETGDAPAFELADTLKSKDFGLITMKENTKELGEVVVRSGKPLLQQRIDGTVVNVESSVLSKGSSALEVLERSPGVVIDHQNNEIALNGKSGVMVMVNGKLMRMPMEQLVSLLQGMSADDIEKIELLTTPPSKYDAEGNAGLINIVLKKNKKAGTNGSASLTGGWGWGEKGTGSVNLSHNTANIDLYGSYTFLHDRSFNNLFVEGTQDFPPLGGKLSNLTWDTTKSVQNAHNFTFGLDARVNAKTTLGGNITYNNSTVSSASIDHEEFTVLPDSLLLLHGGIHGINRWRNIISSVYLERKIREGEQINIDLDYLYYKNDNPSDVQSSFLNKDGDEAGTSSGLYASHQKSFAKTGIQVGVLKADYTKQLSKKTRLETGIKGTYTRDSSISGIERFINGAWVTSPETSNDILMKESIGALYASLNTQINPATTLGLGARYEYSHTRMEDPATGKNTINRRLGALFPTLSLTRKLTDRSELQLSYTKRISRPSYNDLASFIGYSGPIAAYTGNPSLKPTITNNLKLGYNYRGYSFSVLLSRDDDPIARYQLTKNPAGNLLYVSPQNLIYQNNLTFQANLPWKVKDWWTMNYGFVGGWRQFKENYTQTPVEKTYFAYSLSFNETFLLPRHFSIEVSGWYNASAYNGATKMDGFGVLNAGLKKELNGNGGTFQLSASDLLRTLSINGYHGHLTEEVFNEKNHFTYNTESTVFPILKLTYTKSFGSSAAKSQRKQPAGSGEETERIRKD